VPLRKRSTRLPPSFDRFAWYSLILLTVSTIGAGCESHPGAGTARDDREVARLIETPRNVSSLCQKVLGARSRCPSLLPAATGPLEASAIGSGAGITLKTLNIEQGVFDAQLASRPPEFVHVVLQKGDLASTEETFSYSRSHVVRARNGLLDSQVRRRLAAHAEAVFLGSRSWRHHRGDLILVPSFESVDSIHAGHLLFRWKRGRETLMISLHAWEPLTEAVATLRCVVVSTGLSLRIPSDCSSALAR
jgi:hypothetical protein